MQFKDYYQTLGVPRDASDEAIKKAYRKLARKYHPDVSKEPRAAERMAEINEAHAVLGDPERRAAYDAVGQGHQAGERFTPPPGWDAGFEFSGRGFDDADGLGGHFSEFFEQLFGSRTGAAGRGARGGARHPGRGEDHHARVVLPLADAWTGPTRQITLRVPQQDAQGRTVLGTRTLDVRIPRGLKPGARIRLAGQGEPGPGGSAGDLYLELSYEDDAVFTLDGNRLSTELPVAPWEAALGAVVPVTLPDGSRLEVRVPAGAQSGQQLTVRGKGLPSSPPGDLDLTVRVLLPSAKDPRARAHYEAMARELADFDARRQAQAMREG